jgi:hypothetical protein
MGGIRFRKLGVTQYGSSETGRSLPLIGLDVESLVRLLDEIRKKWLG